MVSQILLFIMNVIIWSPIRAIPETMIPSPIFNSISPDSGCETRERGAASKARIGVEEIEVGIVQSIMWERLGGFVCVNAGVIRFILESISDAPMFVIHMH